MDHQDWNTITFKNNKNNNNDNKNKLKNQNDPLKKKMQLLDESTDGCKIEKVNSNICKQIQQGRSLKNMKQIDLANKCNTNVKIIQDYESGKSIVDKQLERKIQNALGIKFEK